MASRLPAETLKPDVRPDQTTPDPTPSGAVSDQPVAPAPGQLALFASVFLFVAAAAVVGAWMLFFTDAAPSFNNAKTAAPLPSPAELAALQVVGCPAQPIAAVAGDKDGRFPMQADESGLIAADIASFLILGQAALAAGRGRDAEVALLMSCRIADKLKGSASVESADARYQLGRHYTELALQESPAGAANRPELLARAKALYAGSLLAYAARFGDGHEKSRLAADGLASTRQTLAQTPRPSALIPGPATNADLSVMAEKPSGPARPGTTAAKPTQRTLPATGGEAKILQAPLGIKDCPPAVATLGLCDPPS